MPNDERSPKPETVENRTGGRPIGTSDFGFLSAFVIRIWSLSSAISLRRLRSLSARTDRCWRCSQSKPNLCSWAIEQLL